MRWIAKAVVQKGLSTLPGGERVNYLLQRHVTHSLPCSDKTLRRRFRRAAAHLQAYLEHGPGRPLERAVFYGFGAGWELTEQIASWCLGVDRRVLVDIRPNLRLDLVNVTLERLNRLLPDLGQAVGRELRDPGSRPLTSAAELKSRFGIDYLAPCDARATGLETGSVDSISSTNTLEHVPAEDLPAILAECRRLLRSDGVLSCAIDLGDHFADFDRSISRYNFLRFSTPTWRLVNSRLLYQNRLRYSDYVQAFAAAGFEVLVVGKGAPRPKALRRLAKVPVATELRGRYTEEELAVKWVTIIARPLPDTLVTTRFEEAPQFPGLRLGAG